MTEKQQRSLEPRERRIILLYSSCNLIMTPQEFYSRWLVTHDDVALICRRATSTVNKWFSPSSNRQASFNDKHHLALANFLLEHYEEMPDSWQELLFDLRF